MCKKSKSQIYKNALGDQGVDISISKEIHQMKYYLAPLEGITTYIFRRAYHNHFMSMDKYFTPFLVPHLKKGFSTKEQNDILPEHSKGMYVVPQIMSNDAEGFLNTVKKLEVYGYKEVNLNLGCPSKTVVSKYRGSGFLVKTEELDRFLDEIYRGTDVKISIKTRLGKESPEEFERLLEIYNQYPLEELIIHPRVQKEFYKNTPHLDEFQRAVEDSGHNLCYNGDIFAVEDYEKICEKFPSVQMMMLGRGIIGNPALLNQIRREDEEKTGAVPRVYREMLPEDRAAIRGFHDQVLEDYLDIDLGERNTLFKMKELWCYMKDLCPGEEKMLKKIKKAQSVSEYKAVADFILF